MLVYKGKFELKLYIFYKYVKCAITAISPGLFQPSQRRQGQDNVFLLIIMHYYEKLYQQHLKMLLHRFVRLLRTFFDLPNRPFSKSA